MLQLIHALPLSSWVCGQGRSALLRACAGGGGASAALIDTMFSPSLAGARVALSAAVTLPGFSN
ncbi:hypothetical protein JJW18_21455 [Stenotrophomonas lactitubi]|uniref:Uncharacterized protein n=1 Tax=Stenotrophomonas lactitubi TaxID=2045214 RepID=A0AAW4GPG2_9GAMM|nr:hypothetical protein [Stenotrophomonas lactitubi]